MFRVDWEIDVESPPVPLFLSSPASRCAARPVGMPTACARLAPPAYVRRSCRRRERREGGAARATRGDGHPASSRRIGRRSAPASMPTSTSIRVWSLRVAARTLRCTRCRERAARRLDRRDGRRRRTPRRPGRQRRPRALPRGGRRRDGLPAGRRAMIPGLRRADLGDAGGADLRSTEAKGCARRIRPSFGAVVWTGTRIRAEDPSCLRGQMAWVALEADQGHAGFSGSRVRSISTL